MRRYFTCFVLLLALAAAGCGSDDREPEQRSQAPATAPPAAAANEPRAAAPAAAKPAGAVAKMAPTPATVIRDTELKEKPFVDAKTLKRLPARSPVTIVDRNGGWLKVTVGGEQGWVRLLHVSSQPSAGSADAARELEAAAKIATGRAGSGNIVSTTGIRGLSEEQLRAAKPNPEELQRLERYGATPEQAAAYAGAHKLERRQIPYLPEPG